MGRENEGDVAVGESALPVGRLVSDLYNLFPGRPAIVVGGGPSAPDQTAQLAPIHRGMVVISANAHAAKLGLRPDFIVCKDHRHTETKELMEHTLRNEGRGAPIVARHYWADYRLPRWPIQGNSGLMALGFAALLGCEPIFPVGFDCYQGATYFHEHNAKNVSHGLRDSVWRSRAQRIAAKLATADIRLLGPSPLSAAFRQHNPLEPPRGHGIPPVLHFYAGMQTHYARARVPFAMRQDPSAEVPVGRIVPMDAEELAYHVRMDHVEIVDRAPVAAV